MNILHTWLVSMAIFGVLEVLGRFWQPSGEKRPWAKRLKNSWLRWPFKALMAALAGYSLVWWINHRWPIIRPETRVEAVAVSLSLFVSLGLGVTLGKWLTMQNAQVVGEKDV